MKTTVYVQVGGLDWSFVDEDSRNLLKNTAPERFVEIKSANGTMVEISKIPITLKTAQMLCRDDGDIILTREKPAPCRGFRIMDSCETGNEQVTALSDWYIVPTYAMVRDSKFEAEQAVVYEQRKRQVAADASVSLASLLRRQTHYLLAIKSRRNSDVVAI